MSLLLLARDVVAAGSRRGAAVRAVGRSRGDAVREAAQRERRAGSRTARGLYRVGSERLSAQPKGYGIIGRLNHFTLDAFIYPLSLLRLDRVLELGDLLRFRDQWRLGKW